MSAPQVVLASIVRKDDRRMPDDKLVILFPRSRRGDSGSASLNGLTIRITPFEAIILGTIAVATATGGFATREDLATAVYGDQPDGGAGSRSIDAQICRMAKKLASIGLAIESIGYRGRTVARIEKQLLAEAIPLAA